MQVARCEGPTVPLLPSTTTFRESKTYQHRRIAYAVSSTVSRKNFKDVQSFIAEPDSRAQCQALEENVKEFGVTYFGMTDRRQGTYPLLLPLM